MDLRRRFVLGAADWMAGKNGSMQNDKLLFGYTDSQWEYIWCTMLEDGAWAVPGIKDKKGNIIKENFAPEILIKFIAHDIKCHIIVFDLVLDRIQFISGNHLKCNNVVFDSPLLIYSTGSHFQAVFQDDHEFFVNFSKELEAENTNPQGGHSLSHQDGSQSSDQVVSSANKCSEAVELKNKLNDVSLSTNENSEDQNFQIIRNIKKKDRTSEQQRLFEKINEQRQRSRESAA